MERMLMQSIEGEPFLWRAVSIEEDLPPTIKNRLLSFNDCLIDKIFTIPGGDTKTLGLEARSYLKEVLKLLRNLRVDKNLFSLYLEEQFNSYNSELLSFKLNIAAEMVTEVKRLFEFEEFHRNIFSKNTERATQEAIFVTMIIESKDLSKEFLASSFLKYLKELIIAYNPATEEYINELASKKFEKFKDSYEMISRSMQTRIEEYLYNTVVAPKTQRVDLQFFRIANNANIKESTWDTVFQSYYILEPLELKQILKIGKNTILAIFSLGESDKIMIMHIEALVVTQPYKFFHGKDTMIARGSIPELMILINDKEKKAYSACLTNKKLIIKEELHIYNDKNKEIISACLIANKNHILYVYKPGGVDQYSLTGNLTMGFSFIPPHFQLEIAVFEKRFIVLRSTNELLFFNYDLMIIGKETCQPDFFLVEAGEITMVNINESGFVVKTIKKIQMDNAKKSLESSLSIHKIGLISRNAVELGKDIYSSLLKKNSFSSIVESESSRNSLPTGDICSNGSRKSSIDQ